MVAMQLDTTAMENATRFLKRDPTPECVSGENRNMKTFMPPSVHSSTVYNNPDMEATSVSSMCVCVYVLSCVQLFATPRTTAHQTPLSMEFSRQE